MVVKVSAKFTYYFVTVSKTTSLLTTTASMSHILKKLKTSSQFEEDIMQMGYEF